MIFDKVDLPELRDMLRLGIRANERGELDMRNWICNTAGCLCGTYVLGNAGLRPIGLPSLIVSRLSITSWQAGSRIVPYTRLFNFLFSCQDSNSSRVTNAHKLSGTGAIRRLTKVITYLELKQTKWNDAQEEMRTEAPADVRTPTGDWNFVNIAAKSVAV